MKAKHVLKCTLFAALALGLSACGGDKKSGNPNPNQHNPYQNVPYQPGQQVNQQGYSCQNGLIQLRTDFGNQQCFPTNHLAQACSELGGVVMNNLCRRERDLRGSIDRSIRSNGYSPVSVPFSVRLFQGETIRLEGRLNADYDSRWSAQLLQNGSVVGSTTSSSYSMGNDGNFVLASTGFGNAQYAYGNQQQLVNQQYPVGQVHQNGQPYYPNQQYPQHVNQQYPHVNQVNYPGQVGVQAQVGVNGYMNTGMMWNTGGFMNQGIMQTYMLQVLVEGRARLDLRAKAVSCEDGRGNSYPCL